MGRVTAINGARLTIEDYDKASQVIEVNDQTKVFKGHGSAVTQQILAPAGTTPPSGVKVIGLANIKLGDNLFAVGAPKFPPTVALKDNIFLSSQIAVMAAGADSGTSGATPER